MKTGGESFDGQPFEGASSVSTASLHEAGGRIGALPAHIRPLSPDLELCGPAYPVRCPPGDNLFLHHAIQDASPGDILVVEAGDAPYGYLGDIMGLAAQQRGIAGLVIAGGVRDSRSLVAMGWPVFASHVAIRGTGKDPAGPGSLGTPITIGDVKIERGDLVRGDADGVVVLPAAPAPGIIAAAVTREDDERRIADQLRAGGSTIEIYRLPELEPPSLEPAAAARRSIDVAGLGHAALPIPVASRIGNIAGSGGIRGVDPATGDMPDDVGRQALLMFDNVRRVVQAAGGTCSDILKMTIWIATPEARAAINPPWLAMFPDAASRPARHILSYDLPAGMLVQCEFLAVLRSVP